MQCLGFPLLISQPLRFSSCRISSPILRERARRPRTARSASTCNRVFNVPVGSNGHISLSVVKPILTSHPRNVIIRLPPGPIFQPSKNDQNNEATAETADTAASEHSLADITSSTIVTINYRLGLDPHQPPNPDPGSKTDGNVIFYRFPTPIHDTLAGFDWVLNTLKPHRLGVLGTHVGASLALMLALTEPRSVRAVAAVEPICDWTSLDEYCVRVSSTPGAEAGAEAESIKARKVKRKSRAPAHAPSDLLPLLQAREKYFTTPERYFDAFASPVLFLRAAGKDVPRRFPRYRVSVEDSVPVIVVDEATDGEDVDFWDVYLPEDGGEGGEYADSGTEAGRDKEGRGPPIRRRKALSRWPPYGLDYGISGPRSSSRSEERVKKLEVTLPHVGVFTRQAQLPSQDINTSTAEESSQRTRSRRPQKTVLATQGAEMVEVMRRACFWDREKGFAEGRVGLFPLPLPLSGPVPDLNSGPGGLDEAGKWLSERLDCSTEET